MKGLVEIYRNTPDGRSELILSESNLIMDGAAESVVDFLTMPSAVAIVDGAVQERVLDASNYIIQGFTVGKGAGGYLQNLHKYKKHNFVSGAGTIGAAPNPYSKLNVNISLYGESSPFDLSSHVLQLNAPQGVTTSSHLVFDGFNSHLSGMVNAPMIFTVDCKYDFEYPPENINSGTGAGRGVTSLRLDRHGSSTSGSFYWDSSGNGICSIKPGGDTLVKDIGGGWYRLGLVSPSGVSVVSTSPSAFVFPGGSTSGGGGDFSYVSTSPSGGIFLSRPSLNLGSVPLNYFLGSESEFNSTKDFQEFPVLASSIPCLSGIDNKNVSSMILLNGPGTLRNNTSGYDPYLALPQKQNPVLSGLEPGSLTDYASVIDGTIKADHNLNFAGFYGKSKNIYNYLDNWSVDTILATSAMMSDCRWLGGHGFAGVGQSNYTLVSSLSYESFNNPQVITAKSITIGGLNVARSTDIFGYTRARYQKLGEVVTGGVTPYFLLCKSGVTDPSAGLVEFEVQLSDNDMATNNAFGGIMTMGLYSLDYRKMLSKGVPSNRSIDKNVDTGDDMEFRLFSRKVFNESITATSDYSVTGSALSANATITIKWRLEFV